MGWGGGDEGVGIWSLEKHYHEFESQSPALCAICNVATNMARVFPKGLGCTHGWYMGGGEGRMRMGGGWRVVGRGRVTTA